jgi:hypothetical protein
MRSIAWELTLPLITIALQRSRLAARRLDGIVEVIVKACPWLDLTLRFLQARHDHTELVSLLCKAVGVAARGTVNASMLGEAETHGNHMTWRTSMYCAVLKTFLIHPPACFASSRIGTCFASSRIEQTSAAQTAGVRCLPRQSVTIFDWIVMR